MSVTHSRNAYFYVNLYVDNAYCRTVCFEFGITEGTTLYSRSLNPADGAVALIDPYLRPDNKTPANKVIINAQISVYTDISYINTPLYIQKYKWRSECGTTRHNTFKYDAGNSKTTETLQNGNAKVAAETNGLGVPGATFQVQINTAAIGMRTATDCQNAGEDHSTDQNSLNLDIYFETIPSLEVRYSLNGGTGDDSTQFRYIHQATFNLHSAPTKSYKVKYETFGKATTPAATVLSCTFLGWEWMDTLYAAGSEWTADTGAIMTASWRNPTMTSACYKKTLSGLSSGYVFGPYGEEASTDTSNIIWCLDEDLTQPVTADTVITSDITLYAKYRYIVTIDAGAGRTVWNGSDKIGQSIEYLKLHNVNFSGFQYFIISENSISMDGSEGVIDMDSDTFEVTGYKSSYDRVEYKLTDSYTKNAPTTFTPVIKPVQVTVTFRTGFGTNGVVKKFTVDYGSNVTPPKSILLARQDVKDRISQGFKFVGWSGSYRNVRQDSTVVAVWNVSPIWIRVKVLENGEYVGKWIAYEPEQDD